MTFTDPDRNLWMATSGPVRGEPTRSPTKEVRDDVEESSSDVEKYFEGKSESLAIFKIVAERIAALGPSDITVASQISWGRTRKSPGSGCTKRIRAECLISCSPSIERWRATWFEM